MVFSIGLVLSAGGTLGDPWHAGVLSRLQSATGWDAREADLIVGTSAGSITTATLRSGVSALDRVARFNGNSLSPEAEAIYARVTTEYAEPDLPRDWRPMSPRMSLKAIWPPWKPEPIRMVLGGLPRGTKSGESLEARVNEMMAARWPTDPTWIVAVRMDDGRRIVFGRDDVRGNIGQAVRASSAIPGIYIPGKIGDREYVDGGVHSSTNADLTATLGFDLVIVSSAMTATPDARSRLSDPTRFWFSRKLDKEVGAIRSHGTAVIVFEPDKIALKELSRHHDQARSRAAGAGEAAVDRLLGGVAGDGLRELMSRP